MWHACIEYRCRSFLAIDPDLDPVMERLLPTGPYIVSMFIGGTCFAASSTVIVNNPELRTVERRTMSDVRVGNTVLVRSIGRTFSDTTLAMPKPLMSACLTP